MISIIALLLVAGCADVKAIQKVGDFGTAFGASPDEQKAIDWFKTTYGDPMANNDKPARFVEPMITSGISDKNLPVDKVTTFPVSGGSVYFFVIYDNFQKGDPIKVSWTYLENGKEVTSVKQEAGGDFGRFIVEFQKPDTGWGKGKQRITVTGDGATASVDFAIGDVLQTKPLPYNPAGGATGQQGVTTNSSSVNGGSIAARAAPTNILDTGSMKAGCPPGQVVCDGKCVDLRSDDINCGVCHKECDESFKCKNGICVINCDPGQTDCNGHCVDLKSDIKNCGTCGTICEKEYSFSYPVCRETGSCGWDCYTGYKKIFGPENLGHYGCVLESDVIDSNSQAHHRDMTHCSDDLSDAFKYWCDDRCVPVNHDDDNCGFCGRKCPWGSKCVSPAMCCSLLGVCGPPPP